MKFALKSIALASVLAVAGFAIHAQPMEHDAMDGGPRIEHMRRMDPAKLEAMIAKHTNELKAKLKITANQEPAWNTFVASLKAAVPHPQARPDPAEMEKLSTPERIDKMHALRAQHMADMNAAMDKRDEAVKTFYAVLTPEQKKTFDAEHARMEKRMHH